jgi:tetratricopeptide (TPR) repeat protein
VEDESGLHVLTKILTWRCVFSNWLFDLEESERLADAALTLINSPVLAQHESRALQAVIALELGYNNFRTHVLEAKQHFNHSYELSEQIDDKIGMAYALVGLGRSCRTQYRFEEAEALLSRGVWLHESEGNQLGHCDALMALGSVVFRQQRFDEAEHLFKQCLSVSFSSDQPTVDQAFFRLSLVYLESGRFTQAVAMINDCISLRRIRCGQGLVAWSEVYGGVIYRDMGEYEKGRKAAEEALALAQTSEVEYIIGMALVLLGSIDLLEGDILLAYQRVQEGVARQLTPSMVRDDQGCRAWLGFAARAVQRQDEARRHLLAELNQALNSRRYLALLTSLAGLTLLLADEGEVEQAVELHALLLKHPYTANAHWFSQIITPDIATAAAALSAEQRSAAEERGRALDLWEVAAELVEMRGNGGPVT